MDKVQAFAVLAAKELEKTVILANQGVRLPYYPFITYQSLDPDFSGIVSRVDDVNDTTVTTTYEYRVENTIQFNFCGKSTLDIDKEVKDFVNWIRFTGRQVIKDNGFGIIEISRINDTTHLEQGKIFYRKSLDLTIDYTEETTGNVENCQSVTYENQNTGETDTIEREE